MEIAKSSDHSSILKGPFLLAAELGVCEVVEKIMETYPDAIWFTNENNHNILHLAVMNRQKKVLRLICGRSGYKHMLLRSRDIDKNNILHLAGKPKSQSNQLPSAALDMQHELQWFKKVEKRVPPDYRLEKNSEGKTPRMVFIEEHKELIKEGEEWIKGAASSCSLAASFIATIVFAAAITIPGDYNDDGHPNLYEQTAFTIFSIFNSFCFFTSIGAIIMFVSILTSRYGEEDFLFSLPKQLTWCYVMLFYSIASLMIAFCATLYLVFRERNSNWVLSLVVGVPIVPLCLFVSAKYSLLCELIMSTFSFSISRKLKRWYKIVAKLRTRSRVSSN
ncbi:ankyrin repeat-containing protein ITN1-like [Pistacia vera]|uniref:ankyrin repeat-containing protein ITN1-like n=1 Tax=Pistacia vera TaxID=55513 RepID=UPI001262B114|nr:ankyrin repeat-containing protein ITN1-like [Pistacia vera]